MSQNQEHLRDIVRLLWKKRWILIGVTIAAGILTALLTLAMSNYYRASTTFYAASLDMVKPETMFGTSNSEMNYYGSDPEQDRLLSVARSEALARHMVDQFDLYEHYDIDTSTAEQQQFHKVRNRFFSLYEIRKTELDAIKVSIEDTDPALAARMANSAREKIDELARYSVRNSQKNMIDIFKKELNQNSAKISRLADSLENMRDEYGIYSPGSQSEQLSSMVTRLESQLDKDRASLPILEESRTIPRDTIVMIKARINGMENQLDKLTDTSSTSRINLSKFNKGRTAIEMIQLMYDRMKSQQSYDRIRHDKLKAAHNAEVSTIHLIEAASIPEVKSRPTRSLIVLGVAAATFFFVSLLILIRERYLEQKQSDSTATFDRDYA